MNQEAGNENSAMVRVRAGKQGLPAGLSQRCVSSGKLFKTLISVLVKQGVRLMNV